nr:MAG TPA: hypothetical protein [Caudoviricetes sp.]
MSNIFISIASVNKPKNIHIVTIAYQPHLPL